MHGSSQSSVQLLMHKFSKLLYLQCLLLLIGLIGYLSYWMRLLVGKAASIIVTGDQSSVYVCVCVYVKKQCVWICSMLVHFGRFVHWTCFHSASGFFFPIDWWCFGWYEPWIWVFGSKMLSILDTLNGRWVKVSVEFFRYWLLADWRSLYVYVVFTNMCNFKKVLKMIVKK